MLIKEFKNKISTVRKILEEQKIERYALLIAKVQISGTIPDDMTAREFSDIAFWDAVSRREQAIEAHIRKQMGVTGVIDSASALAPKGE